MLDLLESPELEYLVTPYAVMQKALFLLALTTALSASQLHAVVRHSAWLVFSPDGSKVSLTPPPRFLAKNEREDR